MKRMVCAVMALLLTGCAAGQVRSSAPVTDGQPAAAVHRHKRRVFSLFQKFIIFYHFYFLPQLIGNIKNYLVFCFKI